MLTHFLFYVAFTFLIYAAYGWIPTAIWILVVMMVAYEASKS